MVRMLYRFFAASPRRSSTPVRRWSNRLSRSTDRGISKQGEPSRPTPSRILPSSGIRSEEHTSELQSQSNLVCRLLLEKKKKKRKKKMNNINTNVIRLQQKMR